MTIETVFSFYCACQICCGPSAKGITATVEVPVEGKTVATPFKSQLGKMAVINIPGVATNWVVHLGDRMPEKWQGKRYDVFIADHKKALQWGLKRGTLRVLP